MQPLHKMVLACTTGMMIGAGVTGALMAQSAPSNPAYLVANITDVSDAAGYKGYTDGVGATQMPFGGHAIIRGGSAVAPGTEDPSWMAGAPHGRVTVIAFPSMDKLKAWWSSPDYDRLRLIREKSTKGTIYAVEGAPQP